MGKKRSKGVTIFGWAEIIIGITGLVILVLSLIPRTRPSGPDTVVLPAYMPLLAVCLSVIPFLFVGTFTLKLSPVARRINIIGSPILSLIVMVFLRTIIAYSPYSLNYYQNLIFARIMWGIFLLMLLGTIYFFTRPKVKEQFK